MAGKAWMNGMTPYLDFTDSKGPLLWLIYGIGYLLSPTSFNGVFWLGVLFYWGTFWFIYKTAFLLMRSASKALMAVFASTLFFFIPVIHFEIRAEDYCQLFFAIVFYTLVRSCLEKSFPRHLAFLTGLSIGGALLIKFNIAAILMVPAFFILTSAVKYGAGNYARYFGCMVLGFMAIVVPFLIYFISTGSIGDFYQEYFVNTLSTVGNIQGLPGEMPDGRHSGLAFLLLSKSWLGIVFKVSLILVAWLPLRLYKDNLLRVGIWVSFLATAIMCSSVIHEYYLNSLAIFCVFGVITAVSYLRKVTMAGSVVSAAVVIAIIVLAENSFLGKGEFADVKSARLLNEHYRQIDKIMEAYSAKKDGTPTISYVGLQDHGEHLKSGVLPGTKYWAHQNGSNPEMHRRNAEDVFINRPDFVVISGDDGYYRTRLEEAGYHNAYTYTYDIPESDTIPPKILYVKGE